MTIAALLAGAALFSGTHGYADLTPTDDIWVYPHASDPMKDPFLRVWGTDSRSVPTKDEPGQSFSMSYLKFDLSEWPKDEKIQSAVLYLTHVADPAFTKELAAKNPVEVRPITADFAEKGWDYTMASTIRPEVGEKAIYGKSAPTAWETGKTFRVEIDLMKGPASLQDAVDAALKQPKPSLRLALASAMDPEVEGMRSVYKFYSKDAEAAYRPVLKIKYEHESAARFVRL